MLDTVADRVPEDPRPALVREVRRRHGLADRDLERATSAFAAGIQSPAYVTNQLRRASGAGPIPAAELTTERVRPYTAPPTSLTPYTGHRSCRAEQAGHGRGRLAALAWRCPAALLLLAGAAGPPSRGKARQPASSGAPGSAPQLTGTQPPWDMSPVDNFAGLVGKDLSPDRVRGPFADCPSPPCSLLPASRPRQMDEHPQLRRRSRS